MMRPYREPWLPPSSVKSGRWRIVAVATAAHPSLTLGEHRFRWFAILRAWVWLRWNPWDDCLIREESGR